MKGKLYTKIPILFLFASVVINAQILNGDFETWTNNVNPDNWFCDNAPGFYLPITKSEDKQSGQYAVRGEVVNFSGTVVPPWIYGGTAGTGFTINSRYALFEGYYKFSPVGGDVLNLYLYMYDSTAAIAYIDTVLNPTSNYSKFSIPMHYFSDRTPNNFWVEFIIYDTTENAANDANLGSYFLLDNLSLTGEAATGIQSAESNLPKDFQVYQNYPNPFNPSTTIKYSIPYSTDVNIRIYDITGNLITTLINGQQDAGIHELTWNGKNSAGLSVVSGIYLYRIKAGNFSKMSKMVLLK